MIANSDRHAGNQSFLTRGAQIVELAPVYDAAIWGDVCVAACADLASVARHPLISQPFGQVARTNVDVIERVRSLASRLPG